MNSFIDSLVSTVDIGLRSSFAKPHASRRSPAQSIDSHALSESDRIRSAELMRVNHVGEVCAQALYQGQAITSRSEHVRTKMQQAADEEIDHLSWCHDRLDELNSTPSYLNPLWYGGSFVIGLTAGLVGDKWSLGFLAETEKQVEKHLHSHLEKLPVDDNKSRAIVAKMAEDEAQHADMAINNGAADIPELIKYAMTASAKVMTTVAAKI